jgi:hypothetical protein
MIYAEHDFTENFCSAVGYSDEFMMKDIIIDEVARLIVEEKSDVVKLLRSNNINVTVNDNNETISNAIVNEVSKGNDSVTNGISEMISRNRFDHDKFKSFLGIGKKKTATQKVAGSGQSSTKQQKDGAFWKKLGSIAKNENTQEGVSGLLALGLKKSFDKKTATTTQQNQANLNERLKINQAANTKRKWNVKKIILVFGIVGAVSFVAWRIYKLKKQNN